MFKESEEDSDVEESPASEAISQSVSEVSDGLEVEGLKVRTQPAPLACKDSLYLIAESMFSEIFEQDYLKSPFSF